MSKPARPSRSFSSVASAVLLVSAVVVPVPAAADWDPQAYVDEDVVEIRTVNAENDEHWFKVWLVVIDGDVYVRLGNRAKRHIDGNTRAPVIGVRIAGEEFEAVETSPAPEMADRVAEAMSDKYTSDFLARLFAHPLTLKLYDDPDGDDPIG